MRWRRLLVSRPVLATRATPEIAQAIQKAHPKAAYHPQARIVVWGPKRIDAKTKVIVATGGNAPAVARQTKVEESGIWQAGYHRATFFQIEYRESDTAGV